VSLYGEIACAVGLMSCLIFGQLDSLGGIVVAFCAVLLNVLEEDARLIRYSNEYARKLVENDGE